MQKTCLILLLLAGSLSARPQVTTAEAPKTAAASAPTVHRVVLKPEKPLADVAGQLVAGKEGGEILYPLPRSTFLKPVQIQVTGQVEAGEVEVAIVDEKGVVLQSGSPHTGSILDRLSLTVPKTGARLRLTVRPQTRCLLREVTITSY